MPLKNMFHVMSKILIVLFAVSLLCACGDSSEQQAAKKAQDTAKPQPKSEPPVLTAQINSAPLFDSQEGWGPGYAKAIGNGPGVVVGPGAENPNVFAQQFPAKAGAQFKVIARASSVGKPKAKGRFQINWLKAEGQFISTSIEAFEVTPEEKTFETYVTAPAGAVAGTLYVVADGSDDVVRYTEMRLLGKEGRAAKKK